MRTNSFSPRSSISIALAALFIASTAVMAMPAHAATTCTFSTNLTIGTNSDAVKCLQQYLNANGFIISTVGVGSAGHETTQFQNKTEAAVKMWQTANGISPATGTFGSKSRAKYTALTTSVNTPTPTPAPVPTPVPAPTPTPTTPSPTVNQDEEKARTAIKNARDDYKDTLSDYEDAKDDGDDTGKAKTYLANTQDKLLTAFYAFIDKDYTKALSAAKDAQNSVNDAADEMDGKSGNGDKEDANEAIKDAKDDLDSAWDDVDDADDDGKNTSKAESYLDKAKGYIDDAEDSYDSKDYDDALEMTKKAETYIDKALDSI